MAPRSHRRAAFTIVELLVVVSIIALLVGILLPAIGKARNNARITLSKANLRQLGQGVGSYASEWNDRHPTVVNDNLSSYGGDILEALDAFNSVDAGPDNGAHAPIIAGFGPGGSVWAWWMAFPQPYGPLLQPIGFEGNTEHFGWFRLTNAKYFNTYVSGKYFDPVFWSPNDTIPLAYLEHCFSIPHEFDDCYVNDSGPGSDGDSVGILPGYVWSPAALYSPDVFRNPDAGGFQDPFTPGLQSSLRVPAMAQARYSDLKTHMIEHHWLQNRRAECNPAFVGGNFNHCEPFYFNHGYESVPMTLFYDGHVDGVGTQEAMSADARHQQQTGYGLWSRDTPFGENGYLIEDGWDFLVNTSFHVLTTDGILGRDVLE